MESTTSRDDHCHYRGVIVGEGGEHEGHAALSICDGMRGSIFHPDGTSVSIEPAHLHLPGKTLDAEDGKGHIAASFIAFRREDEHDGFRPDARAMANDVVDATRMKMKTLDAGTVHALPAGVFDARHTWRRGRCSGGGGGGGGGDGGVGRRLLQTGVQQLHIEMLVVNDKKRIAQYDTVKTLHEETLHVVNLVNALLKKDIATPVTIVVTKQYDAKDPWADRRHDRVRRGGERDRVAQRVFEVARKPVRSVAVARFRAPLQRPRLRRGNRRARESNRSNRREHMLGLLVRIRRRGLETHPRVLLLHASQRKVHRPAELLLHGLHGYLHGAERQTGGGRVHGGARGWPQVGFDHDGLAAEGTQSCDESKFIMAAVSKFGDTYDSWSQCTVDKFAAALAGNEYFCLAEGDHAVRQHVVDEGEECDCGSADCADRIRVATGRRAS